MKRFSEQLNTKAKTVKMTAAEKRILRERVVSYMEYHPLQAVATPTPYSSELPVAFFNTKTWRSLQWAVPAIFVVVFGLSNIAEEAVPGDTLYAIKQVNEDLRSTMVRGSYEKVVWETELLNRRIAEARVLASEGRLTEEAEIKVAQAVQQHTENARREIETLKGVDEDEATLAAIEFTTALSVQSTALQNQSVKDGNQDSTDLLNAAVQVAAEAVGQVTEDNDLPAYDKLMAKVESETTRAHELLISINGSATPEERGDVERRLSDIDLKITTAKGEVGVDEVRSRESLVSALEQTHKLIVFMMNIDVRASMTVEEVVPVTLTEVERIEKVTTDISESTKLIILIEEALTATTSPEYDLATREKVETALTEAKAAATSAEAALVLDPKDVSVAEGAALEAYNLARDAARLLNILPPEVVGETPVEVTPAEPGLGTTTEETPPESDPEIPTDVEAASSTEEGEEATQNTNI